MSHFEGFKKLVVGTCVWYTVFSILFLIIGVFSGSGESSPNVISFLFLFPAAFSFCSANALLKNKSLSVVLRHLFHYMISVLACFLFILLPNAGVMRGSTVLILLAALSAIYWLLLGVIHIFHKRFRRILEE